MAEFVSRQTAPRRQLGDWGEQLARHTLQAAGLVILEHNWRCAAGEIDIVAQELEADYGQGGAVVPWLVLVEVRTRRGFAYGSALQSITPRKAAKMRQVARHYVRACGWTGPWRLDVVGVQLDRQGQLQSVEHIRHAVSDA